MTAPSSSLVASISLSPKVNVLLLISGFGLGQGSLFAAQSYLIAVQAYELTVVFSLGFALAVLGTLLTDSGGIVLLARRCVALRQDPEALNRLRGYYSALVMIRLLVWVVLVVGVLCYASVSQEPYRYFLVPAILGTVLWCFNTAGVLDGMSLSGFSGLCATGPFIVSAAVLPFLTGMEVEQACRIAGLTYAGGTAAALGLQQILMRVAGLRLGFTPPNLALLRQVALDSGSFQLSFLPGQLLFRGQLAMVNALVPVQAAALFVYGKQAANAAQQIIGFARRATFPRLIEECSSITRPSAREVLTIQKSSIVLTVLFGGLMFGAGLLTLNIFPDWLQDIGFAMFLVAATVFSSSVFSAFGQALQATGHFLRLSVFTLLVTISALVSAYLLVGRIGVSAFVVAEVLAHTLGTVLILYFWTHHGFAKDSGKPPRNKT